MNIILIALMIFILVNQARVIVLIYSNFELIKDDALNYAAKKYNIDYCECFVNNKRISFGLNETTKIYIQHEPERYYENIRKG